jgi:hypothetical protein
MITLPRVRDAIVYVILHELSCKGNKWTGVGMVLWDANVYVRPLRVVVLQLRHACILEFNSSIHMITLMFKGNKLDGSWLSVA